MQSVTSAFTAEERDTVRSIAYDLRVSWKKEDNVLDDSFEIGESLINGNDVIAPNPGALTGATSYDYKIESDYVNALGWERGLKFPIGGLTKAFAEAEIDNTTQRFTPRYMGGSSELYTAILPRRPIQIHAGFNYGGASHTVAEFAGVLVKQPQVNVRDRTVNLSAVDYVDFLQNRYLDQTSMFTGMRTDEVLESFMSQLGMSTAQYIFDTGINIIPFGVFDAGTRYANAINQLVEAENGQFYQDEQGRFRFENRQHWDNAPFNAVQRVITTPQVINAQAPDIDNIVNVVEIKARGRSKEPEKIVFNLNAFDAIELTPDGTTEVFVNFDDPVLALSTPSATGQDSYFKANTAADNTGTDLTSSVTLTKITKFAQSAKLTFDNASGFTTFLTQLVMTGRPATVQRDIYYRDKRDASITAYEERPIVIENDYIQNQDWANSLAQMILDDLSDPDNIQKITIRAIPELQLGDLISWQGRYWRVYNIRASLDPSSGFIQELTLLQKTILSYFRIGISLIGGTDKIAP